MFTYFVGKLFQMGMRSFSLSEWIYYDNAGNFNVEVDTFYSVFKYVYTQ